MKKVLMAAAALVFVASAAAAGPNAGGTLIIAESVGTVYTSDVDDYCGSSTTSACESAVVRQDGEGAFVLNVIAAFAPASSPRLQGITWGWSYSPAYPPADWGPCGDFELPNGDWPASGSGTSITWAAAQTDHLVEIYWSAHYAYATYGPGDVVLGENPIQGGSFADDDVPANLDPIAGFGAYGFYTDGIVICPADEAAVACCFADGSCELLFADECDAAGGVLEGSASCNPNPCPQPEIGACCIGEDCTILPSDVCADSAGEFQGADTVCDPNPCVPIPTLETTWGQIKANG